MGILKGFRVRAPWVRITFAFALAAHAAHAQSPGARRAPVTHPVAQGSYAIGPNDLVEVKVFQEDELTTTGRVSTDGTISIPLIGSVRIGGRTSDEAAQYLRERFMKGYLVNPQVNVSVVELAQRRFTVLGQVQKGGTFDFPDQGSVDVLQAIGMAGGYTRIADPGKVTVRRRVGGRDEVIRLDAKSMADRGAKPFEIQAGDVITVGESLF